MLKSWDVACAAPIRRAALIRKPQAGEGDLVASITELSERIRATHQVDDERELLMLRHRLGAQLVGEDRPQPRDESTPFPGLDGNGLAAAPAGGLDGRLIRGGIDEHGYVLVRELIDREAALGLADQIEAAFQARDGGGDGVYEQFDPEPPISRALLGHARRRPARRRLAAGLRRDGRDLRSGRPAAGDRGVPRRAGHDLGREDDPAKGRSRARRAAGTRTAPSWATTRALNVWVALSDCGVDAPGLEFVPRRLDDLIATGGEGSGAEHLDTPEATRSRRSPCWSRRTKRSGRPARSG